MNSRLLLGTLVVSATLLSGCVGYVYPSDHQYGAPRVQHRDLDRDGVPNRYDRDRDGDGVRNRQDRAPNDGRYY